MNKWIRLPGFPPPEKQDSVEFCFFKKLSYSYRVVSYLVLIVIGFLFQIYSLKVWPGIVFLISATMLNLIKGFDNSFIPKAYQLDKNWTPVKMEQIYRIEEIEKKAANWDKDILDISNGKGCFTFLATIFLLIFGCIFLRRYSYFKGVLGIAAADFIVLIFPLWFNGLRGVMRQSSLQIKVGIIKRMEEFFQTKKNDGEIFKPALLLARDKRRASVPTDSRFTITFENMPEGFYGIQAQININMVQGTNYPYFYCVIAAEKGFGLQEHFSKIPYIREVIVEYEEDDNAEVIVIRQRTTKSSGYHTNTADCKRILELSLTAARNIVARHRELQ